MKKYQVIIDTNVIVSAFRSKKGASHLLIKLLHDKDTRWEANISTALVLEYESVLKREMHVQEKSFQMVDDLIDDIVALSNRHRIFYLLRPYLKDKNDDFILELAFSSSTDYIITYNTNNFKRAKSFGIDIITPKDFLQTIGEI